MNTLIIISNPPSLDLEPIELVLALSAFDQNPSILLLGQGLHYANISQQAKKTEGKSPAKVMAALPMYDCENLFIRHSDLQEQGLGQEDLHDFCEILNDEEIKQVIKQSKHCVNF